MIRKILAVSSQVVFGPVGNSAAVPAMQNAGLEVLAVPTILLSYHPGQGRPVAQRMAEDTFSSLLQSVANIGALDDLHGVMTGYFASPEQVLVTAAIIAAAKARQPDLYVLVDPVIGDEEGLYVPEPVAAAIRDHLVPLATCITPNRFELAWLTGLSIDGPNAISAAATGLANPELLATSIPVGLNDLATIIHTAATNRQFSGARQSGVPHGTGDFLAGLYFAARVCGTPPAEAASQSMAALEAAIAASLHKPSLDLAMGLRAMRAANQS